MFFISKRLDAADVFAYTTLGNSIPVSLVESIMCGLSMVTVDISGVHDIVVNGETGYIVSDKDPEKLVLTVKRVLDEGESMRDRSVLKANEFISDKAAKKSR